MRYPNPMDEWNQGYRREYPVSIKGMDRPLQVTLPLSWNLSQNLQLGQNEFMSWRSESGTGQYVVALIETPTGATVDSIVAGLQKARPDAVTENSRILRSFAFTSLLKPMQRMPFITTPFRQEIRSSQSAEKSCAARMKRPKL